MKRRRFLQLLATTGGGLMLALRARADADLPLSLLGDELSRLDAFVRIEANGRIVIGARTPDMGQGSHTLEARIIAEEMAADWSQVEVVALALEARGQGEAEFPLAPQFTLGSTTARHAWEDLRQVGANVRWLLREAAARRWKMPAERLECAQSLVRAADGRSLGYGVLATEAARLPLPGAAPGLMAPGNFRLIGKPAGDIDAEAIVRGQTRFTIDRWMGDAVVAVIARCPYPQGTIAHLDDRLCRKVEGVRDTITLEGPDGTEPLGSTPLAAGVAVLADSTWAALRGRKALDIRWQPGRHAELDSKALESLGTRALADNESAIVVRNDGAIASLASKASRTLEARYHLPLLAHVTMEPLSCLVNLTSDRIRIEAPLQNPQAALGVVARLTGLAPARIEIHVPRMGGGFGRRLDNDHVAEAVRLAQAAKRPIKLMWTREDTLQHDAYRPFSMQHLQAWLDRRGRILGWDHAMASTPWHARRGVPKDQLWRGEVYADALPAGLVENYRLSWRPIDSPIACGNWRAPGHNSTAFARECFLDEIARHTRQDALDLRLALLGEPRQLPYRGPGGPVLDTARMAEVLNRAAEGIGWKRRLKTRRGLGLASHFTFGSYCAHAFELSVERGRLHIHRVVCAVDVGRAINPLGVEAQMIGATLDGISAALHQEITLQHGVVQQKSLRDYHLAANRELPRSVEVHIIDSDAPPSGAGEAGLPSVAPALANAVFDASTVRIRRLPLMPEFNRLL